MNMLSFSSRLDTANYKTFAVEALLGLALISAVNMIWFRVNLGFVGVSPHPYWLIVLMLASRYGFGAGFFGGAACTTFFMLLAAVGRPGSTMMELKELLLGEPILFLIVGIVLGEVRQGQKVRLEKLEASYKDLQETAEQYRKRYEAVIRAKQEVDTRILTQEQTLSTMHETAQALRSLSEGQIYPSALSTLEKFLGVEASSVYMLEEGRLRLKAELGALAGGSRLADAGPEAGLMGQALGKGKVASVNVMLEMYERGELPEADVLISAPLVTSTRKTLGVLNIEKLPFLKFNSQTIRMAEVFAGWCADALENALLYQDTKSKNINDDITGAYTTNYLTSRLTEECARARRYKTPMSIIVLDIVGFADMEEGAQRTALTALSTALKKLLRNIDLLFLADEPGRYVILMPNTPQAGADVVGGKILQLLAEIDVEAELDGRPMQVRMSACAFDDTNNTPELLMQKAVAGVQELG